MSVLCVLSIRCTGCRLIVLLMVLISKACFFNHDRDSHLLSRGTGAGHRSETPGRYLQNPDPLPASSPSKQCNNCWRFGHVKSRCKNPTVYPLCAGSHWKAEYWCPNPTCPRGGNLKPVLDYCIASTALLRFPVPMSCNRQRHYTSTNNNNSKLR